MELDLDAPQYGHSAQCPDHLLLKNQLTTEENIELFNAALNGSTNDVKVALANGGKPNFFLRPEDSKNALHVAAERGHMEIVELLLKHGAVVDTRVASSKATALMLAAINGHDDVILVLIGAGAKVNAVNTYGNTALHEASRQGLKRMMMTLLRAGAIVTSTNKKGSTPLHFFCYGDNEDLFTLDKMKVLIDAGADVHARDSTGKTPLLVCCSTGRWDLINYLIECGADPSAKDDMNNGAYEIAQFHHHTSLAHRFSPDGPLGRYHGIGSAAAGGGGANNRSSSAK